MLLCTVFEKPRHHLAREPPPPVRSQERVLDLRLRLPAGVHQAAEADHRVGVAALQRALKLAKGSSSPPDDWWQALATRAINGESCAQSERDCLIVHRDLDGDGSNEVLLCELYTHRGPDCVLYARGGDGQWRRAGSLFGTVSGQAEAINQALRDGKLTLVPPRWPMLSIGGRPALAIDPEPESNEPSP